MSLTPPSDQTVPEGIQIAQIPQGKHVRVVVFGELDLASSPTLHQELAKARRAHQTVELDLSKLSFIDSTGLGAVIHAYQEARRDGWTLRVSQELAPPVRRLFDMTGVGEYILGPRQPPPHQPTEEP